MPPQVDEAFTLLQDMREQGLAPNRVTYSALINACGRAGQLARAFQTLDEMCKTGIEPNVVTWTTLIDACGKGKVSSGGAGKEEGAAQGGVSSLVVSEMPVFSTRYNLVQ